jgi:hypothetical protein
MKVENLLYFVVFYLEDYEFFLDDESEDFPDEDILKPHNIDKYSIKRSIMDDELYSAIIKHIVDLINKYSSENFFCNNYQANLVTLWKNIKNSYNIHINNDLICAKITISEGNDDYKELSKVYNEEHTDGGLSLPNLFTHKGVNYFIEWCDLSGY